MNLDLNILHLFSDLSGLVHETCIWCSLEFMSYVKIDIEKAELFIYKLKVYLA
jgi:hypothetical protein